MADAALHAQGVAPLARLARAAAGPVFAATVLLGAALVFLIQPMFAKMVLPLLGGGAGVWNVALVFFQGALLAGYIYASVLARLPSLRAQVAIHAGLLALVTLTLPIGIAAGFDAPPTTGAPQFWLIALFTASVGAPYAIVSATAPLMQSWFARTGRPDADNPYRLYAASNLGSLGALLAYPLLVEPALGAQQQALLWSSLYLVLAGAIACCGGAMLVSGAATGRAAPAARAAAPVAPLDALRWMALAFIPSALLVATTTHLSTDVAAAPLLWVAPLALYLVAFSLAFADRPFLPMRAILFAHAIAVAFALAIEYRPMGWEFGVAIALAALFFASFVALRELYARRPEPAQLTLFYVFLSLGGVLGGAFAALLAPMVFDGVWEYPLALAATLLIRPRIFESQPAAGRTALLLLAAFVALVGAAVAGVIDFLMVHALIAFVLAVGAMLLAHRTRVVLAAAALVVAFGAKLIQEEGVLAQDRGFYGVAKVVEDKAGGVREFLHGTTVHGVQALDPARAMTPLGYYGAKAPIGQVFGRMNEAGRISSVAVLGLGAGATACYKRPDQDWLMIEIDPIVVRMAKDPALFTMVSNCAPEARIVVGDARLEFAKEPMGRYDLVFADVFSSDAVPAHLLTREAIALYLDRLTPDGVLVMHVSNRVLELSGIVARTARAAGGYVLFGRYDAPAEESADRSNFTSQVVIVAKTPTALDLWRNEPGWREMPADARPPWTDDRSNILEAMIAKRRPS